MLPLLLNACGDLPQPFRNNPGANGARLAQPPQARLAVLAPTQALLSNTTAPDFATALADSLRDKDLPAVAGAARPGDWRLVTRAELKGGMVVPTYTTYDTQGKDQGHTVGVPVPAAQWSGGDAKTLATIAAADAPRIADLMDKIYAVRIESDPASLYNRPSKIYLPPVTGAPGDGNQSLTQQIRASLGRLNDVVQENQAGADFTVIGHVNAVPVAGGMVRVEITWKMTDAAGHDLGMVLQMNEVPPATISGYWGDVALAVAREAAGGIQKTVLRQSGHAPLPLRDPSAPPTVAPTAAK
jgi:hypothetical protein